MTFGFVGKLTRNRRSYVEQLQGLGAAVCEHANNKTVSQVQHAVEILVLVADLASCHLSARAYAQLR
jgi:hypothetical protein